MAGEFSAPPPSTRPWVYWYWINDHLSREGITRDLEAMADVGIGAALIGNIYLDRIDAPGEVPLLSEEWMELTRHAIREGGRLGVDIGLFNSPGWSQSGGPWNDSTNTMRYLTSTEFTVVGPAHLSAPPPVPGTAFQDVALLAFPAGNDFHPAPPAFRGSGTPDVQFALDKDPVTYTELAGDTAVSLLFTSPTIQAIRSLSLTPGGGTFTAQVTLSAEVDGRWREIRNFRFDRSNPMDQITFRPAPAVEVAFPAVRATTFRLHLSHIQASRGSQRYGLAEVSLSPSPRLEYAVEKQLAHLHPTPLPFDDAYRWPVQAEPADGTGVIPTDSIIDLSSRLAADGTLSWDVPPGRWTVLRTGMVPTGIENSPASPNGKGPEVDKMNRGALRQHWDGFIGKVLKAMPASDRTAFKYVVADSYETGAQNWTDDLAPVFRDSFDYDPIPWLPVLTGRIVGSVEQSNRFLWDLRRLVADRVAYAYVGGMRELCEENDLDLWLENYGHWGFPSEFLTYGGQSTLVGGEFWAEGDLGSIECKAAASAAHIYGKQRVFAESYTAAGQPFRRHPGSLKKRGDWSYTEGINHRVLHVYIQQPYDDRRPGVNAWFGTEFNRLNTWFGEAGAWFDYERRCGYLLRQGHFVADVAYLISEDAPKMTGVTDPPLPPGYDYDYINGEVLKERITVEDGRLTLPSGGSYRVLVLPDSETMRPELLLRIRELIRDGATVVGRPPARSPSLSNYGEADRRISQLAGEVRPLLHDPDSLQHLLRQLTGGPDVISGAGSQVLWTHRKRGDRDIYFLTNQTDSTLSLTASFRQASGEPAWWDPVSGSRMALPEHLRRDGRTDIPLRLAPAQSGFVVFDAEALAYPETVNYSAVEQVHPISGPWTINFRNEYLRTDTTLTEERLLDWSTYDDETIRFFSGTATYATTIRRPQVSENERVVLRVGSAGVLANVFLNGNPVGGLWTAPWELELTDHLREGENQLRIEVTNGWVNQLIHDAARPPDEHKLWTLIPNTYTADEPLQPSGLTGPVELLVR